MIGYPFRNTTYQHTDNLRKDLLKSLDKRFDHIINQDIFLSQHFSNEILVYPPLNLIFKIQLNQKLSHFKNMRSLANCIESN